MRWRSFLAWMACAAITCAQDIDALFKDWTSNTSPGGAVAVVRNGEVVLAKGYGLASLEHGVPITADTVFPAASVSKQFTSMAVLLLEQEGKLALDDDVRRHLSELPDYGSRITIRDLLQHTAGIRDAWELIELGGGRLDDALTNDHVLRLLFRQRELNFAPRSKYSYSNGGYILAAEIVARVSGKTFAEYCQDAIFTPLGMKNTHFHDDLARIVPHQADSYRRGPQRAWARAGYNSATVGPNGLHTSVRDLVRWLDNFRTERVGGGSVIARMRQKIILIDGTTLPNGLGVGVAPMLGFDRVGHNGGDAGFTSSVSYLFGPAFGVAVLGNAAEFNAARLASRVAAAFLSSSPERNAAAEIPKSGPAVRISKQALSRMEGAYRLGGGGVVDVRVGPNSRIEVAFPFRPHTPAFATASNRLWVQAESAQIDFPDAGPGIRIVQESIRTGVLLRRGPPAAFQPGDYVGRYESDEVEAAYSISAVAQNLVLYHVRRRAVPLQPLAEDHFIDPEGYLQEMRFEKDSRGKVIAFRAGNSRVPGVRFVRR